MTDSESEKQIWLKALNQPLRLARTELSNRLMMSAMTLQYGVDGLLSDRHLAFYEARARGEVGLLLSEQLVASPLSESPFGHSLRAYEARQVAQFQRLARVLKPYPTKFFAQLFSAGAAGASMVGLSQWGPVRGPSNIPAPGGEAPAPLSVAEIQQLVEDYARSARNVCDGGLDGIEIHGAHGWLLGQFLSPFYNRRADHYGGTVVNRCRLAVEIGTAIRREIGRGFPLGIALTYDELMGEAAITADDALEQLKFLSSAGLFDFFNVSIGSSHQQHFTIASMVVPQGYSLPFAAAAKKVVGDRAAIFTGGRITDVHLAGRAIAERQADVVGMARALLADPELLVKANRGRATSITRCVGANVCVSRALSDRPVACVLQPRTGREAQWPVMRPTRQPQRIVVVGAGPAGLSYGAAVARAGHHVRVFESKPEAGGSLAVLARLPGRQSWNDAINDMLQSLGDAGGEINYGIAIGPTSAALATADAVVVATGAQWDTPADPGNREAPVALGLDRAIERAANLGAAPFGGHALILDAFGTLPPLALANWLSSLGVKVTFVTSNESIGAVAANELELPHVLPELQRRRVEMIVAHRLQTIRERTVTLDPVWGGPGRLVEDVGSIVFAVSRSSSNELATALAGPCPNVRTIGDALSPRSTAAVIHESASLARSWP